MMNDRNTEIKIAIDAYEMDKARELLRQALKEEANADTYYLASQVAVNDGQRETFLKKAVELDPFHSDAYAQLTKSQSANNVVSLQPTAVLNGVPTITVAAQSQTLTSNPSHYSETLTPGNEVYIRAVTSSTVNLMLVPDTKSSLRSQLPPLTDLIILSREQLGKWSNVVCINPNSGVNIIGWIESAYLRNINVSGRPVTLLDLPLSQYEYNTREEVLVLAELVFKRRWSDPISKWKLLGGLALIIIGLFGLLILIGILAIIGGMVLMNDGTKPFKEESNRLRAIAQNLVSDSEAVRTSRALGANQNLAYAILSGKY